MGRLTKTIAFRVDEDEFRRVDERAAREGLGANDWCRALVLAEAKGAGALGAGERLLYEEVASLRYLVGHGLRLLAAGGLTPEEWEAVTAQADRQAARIAGVLMEKRAAARRDAEES
jgi:hypothetical protein